MFATVLCAYLSGKAFHTGAVTFAGSHLNFGTLEMRLGDAHSQTFSIEAPAMV